MRVALGATTQLVRLERFAFRRLDGHRALPFMPQPRAASRSSLPSSLEGSSRHPLCEANSLDRLVSVCVSQERLDDC